MLRFLHALLQLRVVHRVVVVDASGDVADTSRTAVAATEGDIAIVDRTISFGVVTHAARLRRLQLRNVNSIGSIFTCGNVSNTALVSGRTYRDCIFFICNGTGTQCDAVVSGSNGTRTNSNAIFTLGVGIYAIGVGLEVLGATGGDNVANTVFDISNASIQISDLIVQVSNALGILRYALISDFQLTYVNRIGIR